jgi:hypothetical protein
MHGGRPGFAAIETSLKTACAAVGFIAVLLATLPARAQESEPTLGERFRQRVGELIDPRDGQLDVSPFLERAHGFLPVPIIVTEPAVGYGGGLVALFVRPRHEAGTAGYGRPDLSVVGFVATANGTRMAIAGDSTLWLDGRLKTLVGGLSGNINLDVYGLGRVASEADQAVRYTLDMTGVGGRVDWQLATESPWWVSVRYAYVDVVPKLREDAVFPELENRVRTTLTGPGAALIFDSRDNLFTPTRGAFAETSLFVSDEAFGANRDFRRFAQVLMGWWPVTHSVTLAARADYAQSSQGAPFFVRPYISLRGIPAMRYPGNKVASTEVEARWQFHGRWSVVAFGGMGVARLDEGFSRDKTAGAGGLGFRYELAQKFGLHVGLDVARGPEETAVYLQVGNAWFRP